jgi:hypothetical protein
MWLHMTQPEAKFKRKLNEAFEIAHPEGWRAYVKALAKNGVPDLYYQILGRPGVWVEAKIGGNPLSKTQFLTVGRMVDAGAIVKVLSLLNPDAPKPDRRISIARVGRLGDGRHGAFVDVEAPFRSMSYLSFWNTVLES